jgi:ribosomal protein S27E
VTAAPAQGAPQPMRGWHVDVTCPDCGQPLAHIADGRPSPYQARAVARCTGCGIPYVAQITIAQCGPRYTRGRKR